MYSKHFLLRYLGVFSVKKTSQNKNIFVEFSELCLENNANRSSLVDLFQALFRLQFLIFRDNFTGIPLEYRILIVYHKFRHTLFNASSDLQTTISTPNDFHSLRQYYVILFGCTHTPHIHFFFFEIYSVYKYT